MNIIKKFFEMKKLTIKRYNQELEASNNINASIESNKQRSGDQDEQTRYTAKLQVASAAAYLVTEFKKLLQELEQLEEKYNLSDSSVFSEILNNDVEFSKDFEEVIHSNPVSNFILYKEANRIVILFTSLGGSYTKDFHLDLKMCEELLEKGLIDPETKDGFVLTYGKQIIGM